MNNRTKFYQQPTDKFLQRYRQSQIKRLNNYAVNDSSPQPYLGHQYGPLTIGPKYHLINEDYTQSNIGTTIYDRQYFPDGLI